MHNWGEPERAPHRRKVMRELYICMYVCMYVCMYGTTVTRGAAHTQYTVRFPKYSIFRAIQTACCNVCVLHCASVQHTLPRVQASFKLRMRFSSNRALPLLTMKSQR